MGQPLDLLAPPPPSSASVLGLALRMMTGFEQAPADMPDNVYYQRLVGCKRAGAGAESSSGAESCMDSDKVYYQRLVGCKQAGAFS